MTLTTRPHCCAPTSVHLGKAPSRRAPSTRSPRECYQGNPRATLFPPASHWKGSTWSMPTVLNGRPSLGPLPGEPCHGDAGSQTSLGSASPEVGTEWAHQHGSELQSPALPWLFDPECPHPAECSSASLSGNADQGPVTHCPSQSIGSDSCNSQVVSG